MTGLLRWGGGGGVGARRCPQAKQNFNPVCTVLPPQLWGQKSNPDDPYATLVEAALTFFTSIPMLMHVGPKQECLLFAPPPPIKYGSPGGGWSSSATYSAVPNKIQRSREKTFFD